MECGHSQGPLPFFGYPLLTMEKVKLRTSYFVCNTMHIHRVSWSKSPWKVLGQIAVVVFRESRKFSGHPWGALRGHLWDSTACLLGYFIVLYCVRCFNTANLVNYTCKVWTWTPPSRVFTHSHLKTPPSRHSVARLELSVSASEVIRHAGAIQIRLLLLLLLAKHFQHSL